MTRKKTKPETPAAKAHRFGQFNVKGVRVTRWSLPANRDDDVQWCGFGPPDVQPPTPEMRKRKGRP